MPTHHLRTRIPPGHLRGQLIVRRCLFPPPPLPPNTHHLQLQVVLEEIYLKTRRLPPLFVVGMEGVFGAFVMLSLVLPVVSVVPGQDGNGVHENALDSAVMLGNSTSKLLVMVLVYFVSISFYNFCGLAVSKSLSAVHRVLIDACTTSLVWIVDIVLHYITRHDGTSYGEKWTAWSPLELLGFALTLLGSASYYGVFRCVVAAATRSRRGRVTFGVSCLACSVYIGAPCLACAYLTHAGTRASFTRCQLRRAGSVAPALLWRIYPSTWSTEGDGDVVGWVYMRTAPHKGGTAVRDAERREVSW